MDRHLNYFRLLGITNNTAMNTGVQISVQVSASILLGLYPEVELLYRKAGELLFKDQFDAPLPKKPKLPLTPPGGVDPPCTLTPLILTGLSA